MGAKRKPIPCSLRPLSGRDFFLDQVVTRSPLFPNEDNDELGAGRRGFLGNGLGSEAGVSESYAARHGRAPAGTREFSHSFHHVAHAGHYATATTSRPDIPGSPAAPAAGTDGYQGTVSASAAGSAGAATAAFSTHHRFHGRAHISSARHPADPAGHTGPRRPAAPA